MGRGCLSLNLSTTEIQIEYAIEFILCSKLVPICMPSDAAEFTGRMATVTGWGRLKYNGGVPSVLQEVQVSCSKQQQRTASDDVTQTFHFLATSRNNINSFLIPPHSRSLSLCLQIDVDCSSVWTIFSHFSYLFIFFFSFSIFSSVVCHSSFHRLGANY